MKVRLRALVQGIILVFFFFFFAPCLGAVKIEKSLIDVGTPGWWLILGDVCLSGLAGSVLCLSLRLRVIWEVVGAGIDGLTSPRSLVGWCDRQSLRS